MFVKNVPHPKNEPANISFCLILGPTYVDSWTICKNAHKAETHPLKTGLLSQQRPLMGL